MYLPARVDLLLHEAEGRKAADKRPVTDRPSGSGGISFVRLQFLRGASRGMRARLGYEWCGPWERNAGGR